MRRAAGAQTEATPTQHSVTGNGGGQLFDSLRKISQGLRQLSKTHDESVQQLRGVAVELSTAIAEQLMLRRLDDDKLEIEPIVTIAMRRFEESPRLTVRLHPSDFALLQQQSEQATKQKWSESNVEILPDASVERGNCLANTDEVSACFDWRLQLSEMKQNLLNG